MNNSWLIVNDSCPNCGEYAEILADENGLFQDSAEVRCSQQCGETGNFIWYVDGKSYINWDEAQGEIMTDKLTIMREKFSKNADEFDKLVIELHEGSTLLAENDALMKRVTELEAENLRMKEKIKKYAHNADVITNELLQVDKDKCTAQVWDRVSLALEFAERD